MKKWLVRIGIIFTVILLLATSVGAWLVRRPWPQVAGTLAVSGLQETVEVHRDEWGIPHIYATNEHDLFFAQGYIHAQDRLWQMEMNRRVGNGTLSEILGPIMVETDHFLRALSLQKGAEQEWAEMDSEAYAILAAYTEGVNAYIESNPLPLEFTILGVTPELWSPTDTLVWGRVMSLGLGNNINFELLRARLVAEVGSEKAQQLLPPYAEEQQLIIPPEVENYASWQGIEQLAQPQALTQLLGQMGSWGSNSWVVHGNRTQTGLPLLANDPHLSLEMPSLWYQNGLHGGRFDTVGFTFAGVPLVVIGHNQNIAWGNTNLVPDVQDLYLEKVDDRENPTQYEFMGSWQPLSIVEETINIKGQTAETVKIFSTHHGPLINDFYEDLKNADPVALSWTTIEAGGIFESLVYLNLASNWDEYREALSHWSIAGLNFVYADVDGNIGYQATSNIPIRAAGHQGLLPVPGWTGEYEWQGFIPYEDMPHSFNPATDFIVTANNKVVTDNYPYHIAYEWSAPYRAQQITALILAKAQLSITDMQQIQSETYAVPAETFLPYILAVEPTSPLEVSALTELENWTLNLDVDEVGAAIYQTWYWFFVQNMFGDELAESLLDAYLASPSYANTHVPMLAQLMEQPDNAWFDDVNTEQQETRDEIVKASFVDAVNWLQENYGTNIKKWTWGDLHQITFTHLPLGQSGIGPLESLFNGRILPMAGDNFTVNAGWYDFNQPFTVHTGSSLRIIVDLAELEDSRTVYPTGQSAHLFHPNRDNLTSMWQAVDYYPMLFGQSAVTAHTKTTLQLIPASDE